MFDHTFHSLDEAFMVLNIQREGIPFDAIRYLREQPSSEKLIEEIILSLEHAYDDTYYDEEEDYVYSTPLWYAIVAEEHICKELIEPTISLFTTTRNDWDFLNEQGLYLIGKLAAKYPNLTVRKAVETVDRMVRDESNLPYLFIYDAFYYADVEKYKDWFLQTLQDERLYWIETFAHRLATLQIKEAIPIIKNLLENTQDRFYKIELKEVLEELETGVRKYPNRGKPYCEERGDWEEHYSKFEDMFCDEVEEEDFKQMPVRVKKIGRNEPCPCSSGKKYKKCCLNKDNVFSLPGSNHMGTNSEERQKGYTPGLCTTDGDKFVFVTAYYDINDFEAAKEKIKSIPDLDFPEDDTDKITAVWVVDKKEGPLPNVVYGNITLTPKRLSLECQSHNRLDTGKEMLSKYMGESIRHKLDKIHNIAQMMEEESRKHGTYKKQKSEIPKDVKNQVVAQLMEEHYKRWINEKIPALDNHTPRQAVNDPELRDRLIWLIDDIENMEEQKKLNGNYFFDVNRIRKDLGLEL